MRNDKTRLAYVMSGECRRSKKSKDAFLAWVNSKPEFRKRRPTVDEVVKESRRKGSPLRCIMEQDVPSAAAMYWRQEAQYYLRHVQVVRVLVRTQEVITKPVCAYIPVKFSGHGRIHEEDYVPAQRVADNPALKHSVLERAHADFLAWLERYERYTEFLQAFDPVVAAYRKIEKRLAKATA